VSLHTAWLLLLALAFGPPAAAGAVGAPRFPERCLQARAGNALVRVMHFGDSHLAGATSSASTTCRTFFQSQFGDGGPGLGLPWVTRQPGVTAHASAGWHRSQKAEGDGRMGLGAGFMETWQAGEHAELQGSFARFRLYLLADPAGGKVQVRADEAVQGELDLCGRPGQLMVLDKVLPVQPARGPHRLELRTVRGGRVRILGVALEAAAGVVYSPLAFNGARAAWTLAMPDELFQAQVQAEAPDLIILAFGTNEANAPDFSVEAYSRELAQILGRFRKAAPRAGLLLVGPPDGHLHRGSPATLAGVIAVQKAAAATAGGQFVDQQKAMGGPGAIDAWLERGWARPDLVHLTPQGYQHLAPALLTALFQGSPQINLASLNSRDLPPPPAAPRSSAPRPEPEAARPVRTYRGEEGGIFITDDPSQVAHQPGAWTLVTP
jgi:lysophospholipase L1-like esterase